MKTNIYIYVRDNKLNEKLFLKAANKVARKHGYHHATDVTDGSEVLYTCWGVRTSSGKFFPKIRSIRKVPYRNKKGDLLWWYESMECAVPINEVMREYENYQKSK
jgi:hypothetical protein